MNAYTYSFKVTCPNNGERIQYRLHIESRTTIMVEDIKKACDVESSFHEDLAQQLLPLGGLQVLVAWHDGVLIQTTRGGVR
jgi:hypothetical protein